MAPGRVPDRKSIGPERPGRVHRYARLMAGPYRFIVTWGRMGRHDFMAEVVEAWDPEDAMVVGAELHPELPRPRVAVLASQAGPLKFGIRSTEN